MTNDLANEKVDNELKRLKKEREEKSQKVYMFDVANVSKSNRDWLVRASKSLVKDDKSNKSKPQTNDIIVIDESKNRDEYIAQPNWINDKKEDKKEKVVKKDIKGEIVKKPKITEIKNDEKKEKKEEKVEVKKLNTTKPIFK